MDKERAEDRAELRKEIKSKEKVVREKVMASVKAAAVEGEALQIENKRPADCVLVLEAIARGMTQRECVEKFSMNKGTIKDLARRHRDVIKDWRELLSGHAFMDLQRARTVLNMKWDMMEDDPEQIAKTNVRDLVQSVSMLGEGYLSAVGESKPTVQINMGVSLGDAIKAIHDAKQRARERIGSIDV